MPLLVVAIAFLAVAILFVALTPLLLVQRFRAGTMRQPARGWLLTLNLAGLSVSSVVFLVSAALTSLWIPHALTYSAGGFTAGALTGLIGLKVTRWDTTPDGLFFKPNALLVLTITLAVLARLLYGFWRAWHAWEGLSGRAEWLASAGIAESMAAGGVVLGYYLAYWAGVRRTLSSRRRSLRSGQAR